MLIQISNTGAGKPFFDDSITWILIFILIFILIGGGFYFRSLVKRFKDENKKLSDKLSERSHGVMMQKWELERKHISMTQQNQEILDSLNYAKTIQTAIMPREDVITAWFNDGFIYYRPKDIVSGDFYFLERIGDLIFIAVADCTGHGVAGAFMSMMGSAVLKQIIMQNKITDPAEILQQLNDSIVEALRQKENSSHGGMDIALCSINLSQKKIEFAGANRPLVLIRNYGQEILKPDKSPIGGFHPEENRRFNKQVMDFKEGDCIYMYSDGYADQFGGMDGKKIMTKKFKELLLNIHDSPMRDQRQTLDSYFETWRGRYEQVDDVLVLGVKL